ncbi:Nn.00g079210.m01.CDS01 [Neocucurbitaria sp. VM-36]
MAFSARLERLRNLIQAEIDALPDRAVSLEAAFEFATPNEGSGGLSPEVNQSQTSTIKQTLPIETNSPIKEGSTSADVEASAERRFVWVKDAESSFNPGPLRQSVKPPKTATKLPVTDLHRGDLTSARHHFTPIQALAKYPYKFCNKDHMQDIASAFFDKGKFWDREWDLYYVWDVEPTEPVILVRESQVQTLLTEVNDHLKLGLRITDQQREEGLVACFPDHPRCLPRYLGRSRSREEYDKMVNNTPSDSFRAAGEPAHPPLEGGSLEEFKKMMEELRDIQKAKSKAAKAKRQQERLTKQKSMTDQFKRAQRYLGLRPSVSDATVRSGPPAAIDAMLPTPFGFERSVVFVCVDVESYERAHHKITEIGVATLDTRELTGIAPGKDGVNWRKMIRARHFRINEYRHLVNSEFVTGCPDRFDFGTSTPVNLEDAALHVAACFHAPFGAHHTNGIQGIATLMSKADLSEKRNIIFLGHDTLGDVRYLQQLGYDPMKVENIIEALDTAVMYRVWRREQQATNLGKILDAFDISGWNLHNAGNDATYTVQAMLAICVREATIRGSPELSSIRSEEKASRLAAAVDEAQQKAKDEAEGWSDNEVEGDGGVPVPLAISATPKPIPAEVGSQYVPQYSGPFESGSRGNSRGRGRGRGGPAPHYQAPGNNYRGGRYQGSNEDSRGSARGAYRASSRGQVDQRARGSGSGRGRGRGSFDSNSTLNSNDVHSESQVRLTDFF